MINTSFIFHPTRKTSVLFSVRKKKSKVTRKKKVHKGGGLPGVVGPPGPQSAPLAHPAGPCTAPGSDPSPRVLGWPGSRCELPLLPCRAASAEEEAEKPVSDAKKKHLLILHISLASFLYSIYFKIFVLYSFVAITTDMSTSSELLLLD